MPEEINRVVTDAISDLLLITEESGRRNLLAEGIPADRIYLVGNLMIDSLRQKLEAARHSDVIARLGISAAKYGVLTLHRPANVDDSRQFGEIWSALCMIAETMPIYFPVHPRTRARLAGGSFSVSSNLHLIDPLGYLDFLCLMSRSSVVLTDSGGIQEESTVLGIPCLTVRNNTERPATIEEGTNVLAGTSTSSILAAWEEVRRSPKSGRVPRYWDGSAAERCRVALKAYCSSQTP
jgi:UDP-N-acetylglucosamine 2-epimerase (non-hydrolysing)